MFGIKFCLLEKFLPIEEKYFEIVYFANFGGNIIISLLHSPIKSCLSSESDLLHASDFNIKGDHQRWGREFHLF